MNKLLGISLAVAMLAACNVFAETEVGHNLNYRLTSLEASTNEADYIALTNRVKADENSLGSVSGTVDSVVSSLSAVSNQAVSTAASFANSSNTWDSGTLAFTAGGTVTGTFTTVYTATNGLAVFFMPETNPNGTGVYVTAMTVSNFVANGPGLGTAKWQSHRAGGSR